MSLSQDPSTIEHQEAPGGELYAMPQKPSKKGKKKEEEAHELTEKEKAAALYSVPDRKGQKAKSEGVRAQHLACLVSCTLVVLCVPM